MHSDGWEWKNESAELATSGGGGEGQAGVGGYVLQFCWMGAAGGTT